MYRKKDMFLVVNEPEINCEKATTLNIKTKCFYDEDQKKCNEKNRTCSEIIEGANNEICASASTEKNICLYNKNLKQCIEKSICLSALNIKDEKDCSSLPTSDDIRLKCTIKLEGDNKSCREEEKKCLEIINGATDEIYENKCINKIKCSEIESPSKENCENLITSNEELKCIFDENNKKMIIIII